MNRKRSLLSGLGAIAFCFALSALTQSATGQGTFYFDFRTTATNTARATSVPIGSSARKNRRVDVAANSPVATRTSQTATPTGAPTKTQPAPAVTSAPVQPTASSPRTLAMAIPVGFDGPTRTENVSQDAGSVSADFLRPDLPEMIAVSKISTLTAFASRDYPSKIRFRSGRFAPPNRTGGGGVSLTTGSDDSAAAIPAFGIGPPRTDGVPDIERLQDLLFETTAVYQPAYVITTRSSLRVASSMTEGQITASRAGSFNLTLQTPPTAPNAPSALQFQIAMGIQSPMAAGAMAAQSSQAPATATSSAETAATSSSVATTAASSAVDPRAVLVAAPSVTGGSGSGTIIVNSGDILTNTGSLSAQVMVNQGGTISPGNGPASLSTGAEVWKGGAKFVVQMKDTVAGAGVGWDYLDILGTLDLNTSLSKPAIIDLQSLTLANTPGNVYNFNNTLSYSWPILSAQGGINLPSGQTASTAFSLLYGGFSNPLGGGTFSLSLANQNKSLILSFTPNPIPEPSVECMVLLSFLLFFARLKPAPPTYDPRRKRRDPLAPSQPQRTDHP